MNPIPLNLRLIAARIIADILQGRSLTDRLELELIPIKDERDRRFLKSLCYGVCRFYPRLAIALQYLLRKPLKGKESVLHALLIVGIYQLMFMRIPPYAAISETVNATKDLHKPWAKGLINATLREYLRKKEEIDKKLDLNREAYFAHPSWWIDAIKRDWPKDWEAILAANNAHPPFSLRVNLNHLSREDYIAKLAEVGIQAFTLLSETKAGIILDQASPVESLPGFFAGDVSVQDGAAQLAAYLLDLKPNLRVLDACAAPGGKLTHLIEVEPKLSQLIGIEKEKERMEIIKANLSRTRGEISGPISLICGDASDVNAWWDGKLFDRILIDAPCSGSGVIRRHPDIKLLRKESDMKAYAHVQSKLLSALWPLLKPKGLLLYATCSIFKEENENVLKHFLINHPDAYEIKINADFGLACEIGRQILPGMQQMDGFYYGLLAIR